MRQAKEFRANRPGLEHALGVPALTDSCKDDAPAPPGGIQELSASEEDERDKDERRPRRRKRLSREQIMKTGFTPSLRGRCPVSTRFQQVLIEVAKASPGTAAKKAGVLHRYLDYTRTRQPHMDDTERLTSFHVVMETLEEYRAHFSPRSVVALTESVGSCVTLLQYCTPLQKAVDFKPERHRDAVRSGADLWAKQKAVSNRSAAQTQRHNLSTEPAEGWTELLPVEAVVDYLRDHAPAAAGSPRRREDHLDDDDDRGARRSSYAVARSVAGLFLILSGVRLCVALALSARDIERATEWGGLWIVSVKAHKTSKFHGAAHIVLRANGLRALSDLARATTDYFGEEDAASRDLFGLTPGNGRACEEIFAHFNAFVRQCGYDEDFGCLRFNSARTAAETFSHLLDGVDEKSTGMTKAQRDVTDFLLHSKKVRNLYYRKASCSALVAQWTTFNALLAVLYLLEVMRADRLSLQTHSGESTFSFNRSRIFFKHLLIIITSPP